MVVVFASVPDQPDHALAYFAVPAARAAALRQNGTAFHFVLAVAEGRPKKKPGLRAPMDCVLVRATGRAA